MNIENIQESGYQLTYLQHSNSYRITSDKYKTFEGELHLVWQKMHWEYEIESGEIRFALSEMKRKSHKTAHFGIFGRFILTTEE